MSVLLSQVSRRYLQGMAGGSFEPSETSTLAYWFKASEGVYTDTAGTTTAGDTDAVANWTNHGDTTGHDAAAIQSTPANRLTYHTGGLNGEPYLLGSTANETEFESIPITISNENITIMAVVRNFDAADAPALFVNTIYGDFKLKSTVDAQFDAFDGSFGNHSDPMYMVFRGSASPDATAEEFYVNGTLNDTATAGSFNINAPGSQNFTVLARGNTWWFNGEVYELVVYEAGILDTTLSEWHGYFADKYGI